MLGLRLGARVLLLFLQRVVLFLLLPKFRACSLVATLPPEVNEDKPKTEEDGQGGPHALDLSEVVAPQRFNEQV